MTYELIAALSWKIDMKDKWCTEILLSLTYTLLLYVTITPGFQISTTIYLKYTVWQNDQLAFTLQFTNSLAIKRQRH